MKKPITSMLVATASLFLAGAAFAQKFEAVHSINFQSTSGAKAAMDRMFEDDAMKGARVTLYARSFGDAAASHVIVADFDDYDEFMERQEARLGSHGWARYLLATQDSEYLNGNMVMVIDDHGAPRHTAGYLAAFLINSKDPVAYRAAVKDLNDAIGNPGVLRLVSMKTGSTAVTHAVLIGAEDFAALNEYLDKMTASEAFAEFVKKVGATRKVVGVDMYRRVATWGD